MTSAIEMLYTFDLHIHCGYRSWPDNTELYCEVTFPGLDAPHPITIDYIARVNSLESAIKEASADIATYMEDPDLWVERHIGEQGTAWERRRQLEIELETTKEELERDQHSFRRHQERIAKIQAEMQSL